MAESDSDEELALRDRRQVTRRPIRGPLDSDDSDIEVGSYAKTPSRFTNLLDSGDESDCGFRAKYGLKLKPAASLISSDLLQDVVDKKELCNPSKTFEESIKSCYSKPRRTVERSKSYMEVEEPKLTVRPRAYRVSRLLNHYKDLEDDSVDYKPKYLKKPEDRSASVQTSERRPLKGNDEDSDEDVDIVIGRAQAPSSRYYSRSTMGDPDYYDYDLQASVNMFKTPRYTPNHCPQSWEQKLLCDVNGSYGQEHVATKMFNKSNSADYRNQNSSFLSSALRTDKFWENRFSKLYEGLREKP